MVIIYQMLTTYTAIVWPQSKDTGVLMSNSTKCYAISLGLLYAMYHVSYEDHTEMTIHYGKAELEYCDLICWIILFQQLTDKETLQPFFSHALSVKLLFFDVTSFSCGQK